MYRLNVTFHINNQEKNMIKYRSYRFTPSKQACSQMKKHSALFSPAFSLTLLLSAALLFSVQPMFSKMILPLLGGTPAVWNTAMLFFQVMLLAGYAYAHETTKYLSVRTQGILHIGLLVLFFFVLPFFISHDWQPPAEQDPTLWQLSLMASTVGGPFFVLAASAPMLQRWFTNTDHKDANNPYFLYGASNLGSMGALLAYPTIVEPLLSTSEQTQAWKYGYLILIALIILCQTLSTNFKTNNKEKTYTKNIIITWKLRLYWLTLAFIPSSLMLGVTTFITVDIAAVPLLWVIPLALYVSTFIIVFARKPIISYETTLKIQAVFFIFLIAQLVGHIPLDVVYIISLHLILFFFCALSCHTELAHSKPDPNNLTEFYLVMSLGGALGGFFNAIIAPKFFVIPIEYAIVLTMAAAMRFSSDNEKRIHKTLQKIKNNFKTRGIDCISSLPSIFAFLLVLMTMYSYAMNNTAVWSVCGTIAAICAAYFMDKRWPFALCIGFVLLFFTPGYISLKEEGYKTLYRSRNFYGVTRIIDFKNIERSLLNGTTSHGTQALTEKFRLSPISYYYKNTPINDAFRWLDQKQGKQNIAVVGLGVGVTACFYKKERRFDYYEINPEVVNIAQNKNFFTYLSDCGSPYNIILGDGRLTIQKAADHSYDMIVLDAFTSDNIPAHLLTTEAIQLYIQKLKPNGILLLHISNRYLNLEPVIAAIAKNINIPAYGTINLGGSIPDSELKYYPSHYASLSKNNEYLKYLEKRSWSKAIENKSIKAWTDQFSNIVTAIGNGAGEQRAKILEDKKSTSSP